MRHIVFRVRSFFTRLQGFGKRKRDECVVCDKQLTWWTAVFSYLSEVVPGHWVCSGMCYLKTYAAVEEGMAFVYFDEELL